MQFRHGSLVRKMLLLPERKKLLTYLIQEYKIKNFMPFSFAHGEGEHGLAFLKWGKSHAND
jgi:hypothetical protein